MGHIDVITLNQNNVANFKFLVPCGRCHDATVVLRCHGVAGIRRATDYNPGCWVKRCICRYERYERLERYER